MLTRVLNRVSQEGTRLCSRRVSSKKCFSPYNLRGKLGIIGVPFGKGQNRTGKYEAGLTYAPNFLRETGFCATLQGLGLDIQDIGNIEYDPDFDLVGQNMNNLQYFVPCIKEVACLVFKLLEDSRACLILGGDHSVATGSIYGHLEAAGASNVALVYVDAHADINTNKTSPSGNLHGMTVGFLARELKKEWPVSVRGLDWLQPCLPLKSIAYIGLRSVDPGEATFLYHYGVTVFSMEEVGKLGIHKVLQRAMSEIDPNGNKSIHLSFDIDALDVLEAPCTTVPVRGGLTLREGIEIAEYLHKTSRLSVVDLVEVNSAVGNEFQRELTLDAAKHLLLAMFGYNRRGFPKNSAAGGVMALANPHPIISQHCLHSPWKLTYFRKHKLKDMSDTLKVLVNDHIKIQLESTTFYVAVKLLKTNKLNFEPFNVKQTALSRSYIETQTPTEVEECDNNMDIDKITTITDPQDHNSRL